MKKKILDAHIHLDQYLETEINEIVETPSIAGLISVSTNLLSCKRNLELASKNAKVQAAFGFHPEQHLPAEVEQDELLKWMEKHRDKMIAIGEVGLPYYLKQEQKLSPRESEQHVLLLEEFIKKAKEWGKPIILHAVYEDAAIACDLLEKHSVKNAHFHWFKSDSKTIDRMIENGYRISVTPDVVYKLKTQQLVLDYPLELLMVETDGPWPFEGPFSGDRTHPSMIKKSIQTIAELKRMPIQEVSNRLLNNAVSFYRLQA